MIGKFPQNVSQRRWGDSATRKTQSQGCFSGLQVHSIRIAAGAAPVRRLHAEQSRRVEVERVPMIGIDVVDGTLFGIQERLGAAEIGQDLVCRKIHNPPEACHKMCSLWPDPEKREILKVDKSFCRRMGIQIAPPQPSR